MRLRTVLRSLSSLVESGMRFSDGAYGRSEGGTADTSPSGFRGRSSQGYGQGAPRLELPSPSPTWQVCRCVLCTALDRDSSDASRTRLRTRTAHRSVP